MERGSGSVREVRAFFNEADVVGMSAAQVRRAWGKSLISPVSSSTRPVEGVALGSTSASSIDSGRATIKLETSMSNYEAAATLIHEVLHAKMRTDVDLEDEATHRAAVQS